MRTIVPEQLEADYLVIGSGAMGMAFTDVLLAESEATVVMVDRHHQPGGHWNDAYPYVRLHQPSAFYGVNSRPLGSGRIDTVGWNEGLAELATSSEVCAYFDQVMQQDFLASGRVRYFPMCEVEGESDGVARFRSLVSNAQREVRARKRVDATYMNVMVPSVRPPRYEVSEGAVCVPLGELPRRAGDFEHFVVVGAGKTGMDACLFLLKNGLDPARITWIMPRDSWLLDRAMIQPGTGGLVDSIFAKQMAAIGESDSVADMFARLDQSDLLLRLDPEVTPTMYRCATVTQSELAALRTIDDVVRMGRVHRVEPGRMVLKEGERAVPERTLFVDCTADGLAERPSRPVFSGDTLTLQAVRVCQQVFSAAFIAHVECRFDDEAKKNELCTPVPHPNTDRDFIRTTLQNAGNQALWSQDPALLTWLQRSRLDGFSSEADEPPKPEDMARLAAAAAAIGKMQAYLEEGR